MPDHAVGGIDGFVDDEPGKPENREPERRRDDAVGSVLREALDGRAGNAVLVKRCGLRPTMRPTACRAPSSPP